MTKLSELGRFVAGERLGGEPPTEADHFYVCAACGQAVDRRDIRQVLWHEVPDHEPLEMDA